MASLNGRQLVELYGDTHFTRVIALILIFDVSREVANGRTLKVTRWQQDVQKQMLLNINEILELFQLHRLFR